MICTRLSQTGLFDRGWYVYYAYIDDMLAEQGFLPDERDWTIVGYRRTEVRAKRLAIRAERNLTSKGLRHS